MRSYTGDEFREHWLSHTHACVFSTCTDRFWWNSELHLHAIPLGNCVLREIRRSESQNLLTAVNEILTPTVYNFRRIWTTGLFGTEEDNDSVELNRMCYYHRVSTQLQLNIPYHITSYHIISYHIISYSSNRIWSYYCK